MMLSGGLSAQFEINHIGESTQDFVKIAKELRTKDLKSVASYFFKIFAALTSILSSNTDPLLPFVDTILIYSEIVTQILDKVLV